MHVQSIGKKCSLVLEIFIRTDKIFQYFVNLIRTKLHRIHQGMVINACVYSFEKKYSLVLEIFIRMDKSRTDAQTDGRTESKSFSPTNFCQWGIIMALCVYPLQTYLLWTMESSLWSSNPRLQSVGTLAVSNRCLLKCTYFTGCLEK